MTAVTDIYSFILMAIAGLCLGSFATALIYRIPRGISWIVQSSADKTACRSKCPSCGTVLRVRDLVPLFSWLLCRGRCRHCGNKISPLYPLVESATTILVLLQFAAWGLAVPVFPILAAVPFFIAACVIDWDHMILPDEINAILTGLAVLYVLAIWGQSGWDIAVPATHAAAAVVLVAVLYGLSFVLGRIKGRRALGGGDLKFLPCAGLFLGLSALPAYLVLAGILGLVTAAFKAKSNKNLEFPFGPALIISAYIHLFLTGLGFDYKW